MTRINLVDPAYLSDKHLMAEYRELPRIFTAVAKLQSPPKDIPSHYVLGQGHMKFFYNKLRWLKKRYSFLYHELLRRNFNLDTYMYGQIKAHMSTQASRPGFAIFYTPTPEEIYLNMARIAKRSTFKAVHEELDRE